MKRFFAVFVGIIVLISGCGEAIESPVAEVQVTRVPIIMYHYVREVDKELDPLGWNLSINPVDFERQLEWLRDQGYVGAHLSDVVDGGLPENAVILTFDDGLEDFYTTALPLLDEYGFTASNAIVTGMVGDNEHMNLQQIEEIIDEGIEVTSHSVDHLNLATLDEAELMRQLEESRDYLEENFGMDVRGIVYPSGKYSNFVVEKVREAGYEIAVTTQYGEADLSGELLLLPRIRVDNRDGFDRFVEKMEELRTRHSILNSPVLQI